MVQAHTALRSLELGTFFSGSGRLRAKPCRSLLWKRMKNEVFVFFFFFLVKDHERVFPFSLFYCMNDKVLYPTIEREGVASCSAPYQVQGGLGQLPIVVGESRNRVGCPCPSVEDN